MFGSLQVRFPGPARSFTIVVRYWRKSEQRVLLPKKSVVRMTSDVKQEINQEHLPYLTIFMLPLF